jgi:hypothetical protein
VSSFLGDFPVLTLAGMYYELAIHKDQGGAKPRDFIFFFFSLNFEMLS